MKHGGDNEFHTPRDNFRDDLDRRRNRVKRNIELEFAHFDEGVTGRSASSQGEQSRLSQVLKKSAFMPIISVALAGTVFITAIQSGKSAPAATDPTGSMVIRINFSCCLSPIPHPAKNGGDIRRNSETAQLSYHRPTDSARAAGGKRAGRGFSH